MAKSKIYKCYNDNNLEVVTNRTNIRFELPEGEEVGEYEERNFLFSKKEFREFVDYLEKEVNRIWKNFTPKEANSTGSDYSEYYDREYDNNGYLSLNKSNSSITVTACWNSRNRLYQFNKAKLQSFIFDLKEAENERD